MSTRFIGAGLFFVICIPIFLMIGQCSTQAVGSQANLKRYEETGGGVFDMIAALSEYYKTHRKPATKGQFSLPPVPPKSGVKSWEIREDSVVLGNL